MPFHSVSPYLHSHTPSYILIRFLLLIASSHGLSLFWRSSARLRLCSLSLRLSLTKSSRLQKENSFPLAAVSAVSSSFSLHPRCISLCNCHLVSLISTAWQSVESLVLLSVYLLRRERILQHSTLPASHLSRGSKPVHPSRGVLPQVCQQWRWGLNLG